MTARRSTPTLAFSISFSVTIENECTADNIDIPKTETQERPVQETFRVTTILPSLHEISIDQIRIDDNG